MDNFHIDIVAEGNELLAQAMEIAFKGAPGNKAEAYAVRDAQVGEKYPADYPAEHMRNAVKVPGRARRLILFWCGPGRDIIAPDVVALPFRLDAAGAADFAARWLAEQDYGEQPDHDGDNDKGWRLYNESWGHVESDYRAFVAVTPVWAMYGK